MNIVIKKVYYCEYCFKRSLSAGHMRRHEKHCTANPKRECRMCGNKEFYNDYVTELRASFKVVPLGYWEATDECEERVEWKGEPVTLEQIKEKTGDCPCCTLAVLRQSEMHWGVFGFDFKFKEELREALLERNIKNGNYYY